MGTPNTRTSEQKFYDAALAFNDWCVSYGVVEEGVMCFLPAQIAINKHQKLLHLIQSKFSSGKHVEQITITREEWNK